MSGLALQRLAKERKAWRRCHPQGFIAGPAKNPDGTLSLLTWECGIPGKDGALVDPPGLLMSPRSPEEAESHQESRAGVFDPPLFHPNIYVSGIVCLSLLESRRGWRPTLSLTEILLGLQDLLHHPDIGCPVHAKAYITYIENQPEYDERARAQAKMSAKMAARV
ncbi:SUMO-conjugating enzyme UBC9-B-like [Leptodactylus fuscus]